ncbi:MoaD/ThiS family protein [Halobium salinum]|uniref:MoaD/ThiS family protein n=1 Tax=Halobium salinum TaxID=1364940 RepID=A0ABD5PEP0_9EURY|nr:MoaD/ThiS family protein [Halobium salinum]
MTIRTEPTTVPGDDAEEDSGPDTTVEVHATGHVRTALGRSRFEFTFSGSTLRAFLDAFFAEYDLRGMLLAEGEAEATPRGWVKLDRDPPGTWRKNPAGEQSRPYARILVNGRFNENLDGFDTELRDGDRVALVYPFMFCC